jgi:hypothetical protein
LLARGHGTFNVVGGLWRMLHVGSFELVVALEGGPLARRDGGGLMLTDGAVRFIAGESREGLAQAGRIGLGTAVAPGGIDLAYA